MIIGERYEAFGRSEIRWFASMLHEILTLGLLWYVMQRRGLSFSDIGLRLNFKEVAIGPLLYFAATIAYGFIYGFIRAIMASLGAAPPRHTGVGQALFNQLGPFGFMFQFVNPFFEELIVRAYLMTELKYLTGNMALAILGSVVVQCSYHFYQGAPAAISHLGTFLLFSLYYARTNRILAPIIAHMIADVSAALYYSKHLLHS